MASDHAEHGPHGPHGQIVLTSLSLRQHAATLRAWSRSERERSRAARAVAEGRRAEAWDRGAAEAAPVASALLGPGSDSGGVPRIPLGPVPMTELFLMLIDDHGLSVTEAVRGLAIESAAAGYPPDADAVSAADAFDVILAILHRPR